MKKNRALWFFVGGLLGFAILRRIMAPSDTTVLSDPSLDPVISTERAIAIGRMSRNPLSEHSTVRVALRLHLSALEKAFKSAAGLADDVREFVAGFLPGVAARFDGLVLPSMHFSVRVVTTTEGYDVIVEVPVTYTPPFNTDFAPYVSVRLLENPSLQSHLIGQVEITEG